MAKAPEGQTAATFDGSGTVWFKVYEITAVTDGGTSITFPAQNLPGDVTQFSLNSRVTDVV